MEWKSSIRPLSQSVLHSDQGVLVIAVATRGQVGVDTYLLCVKRLVLPSSTAQYHAVNTEGATGRPRCVCVWGGGDVGRFNQLSVGSAAVVRVFGVLLPGHT